LVTEKGNIKNVFNADVCVRSSNVSFTVLYTCLYLIEFLFTTLNIYFSIEQELEETKKYLAAAKEENEILIISFKDKVFNLFSHIFTPTQINYFLNPGNKITKWGIDDITGAISLRSISSKAYRYLRESLKYPLPGLFLYFLYNCYCGHNFLNYFSSIYFEDMGPKI